MWKMQFSISFYFEEFYLEGKNDAKPSFTINNVKKALLDPDVEWIVDDITDMKRVLKKPLNPVTNKRTYEHHLMFFVCICCIRCNYLPFKLKLIGMSFSVIGSRWRGWRNRGYHHGSSNGILRLIPTVTTKSLSSERQRAIYVRIYLSRSLGCIWKMQSISTATNLNKNINKECVCVCVCVCV